MIGRSAEAGGTMAVSFGSTSSAGFGAAEGFDRLLAWTGRFAGDEARRDADFLLVLDPPGGRGLALHDRRGASPIRLRIEDPAGDLTEKLAERRGPARQPVSATLLLAPESCFVRTLAFPAAALPRMRQILAVELASSTPFRADNILSDWFVEGEDAETGTLRVCHVVLRRDRIAPHLAAIRAAGLRLDSVRVGRSEAAAMPLDLLRDGRHPLPPLLARVRAGDAVLLATAFLLAIAAFWTVRTRQDAVLAGLDAEIASVRTVLATRKQAPDLAAASAAATTLAERAPFGRIVDRVAAALPAGAHADRIEVGPAGLTLSVIATDGPAARAALAAWFGATPAFGTEAVPTSEPARFTATLPPAAIRRASP